jgi:PAS domain S-box-containing protein
MDLGFDAKLKAAFELSPTFLCVTSLADGRVLEVNDAFCRVTRYTREEMIGRTVLELGLWVDPAQREQGLVALRAGNAVRNVEARLRTKDGDVRVIIIAADIVTIDGAPCILNAMMDITDRTRAEAELRASEQRFARLFHGNPLPMAITRLDDDRYLDVNQAASRFSGYAREEMIGRTRVELGLWAVPAQREEVARRLRADGQARDVEVTFRVRSGELRQLVVNAETISYRGEPAVFSVSLDITERKQVEEQGEARRAEAEALTQAKDEFLAMLGHELRNPLGTITNAVAVLERVTPDESARRAVDIVRRQTAHLTRLVDDLLDVARVSSGKVDLRLGRQDLGELARRSVDGLAHAGRTREHEVTVDGAGVPVNADPARIEQVIANLVDNALKYTPAGGRIGVSVERVGDRAVLRVRDTGKGFAPDLLPRAFDVFVQGPQAIDRARGGLGLGLTLVKRLVELHGGTVTAASAGPGLGSEFTVTLPLLVEHDDGASRAALPPSRGRTPRRVLVVEDSDDARESLRMLLTMAGHEVETAEDGPTGLLMLQSFRPEVALVDVGLPGMDGYELARHARSLAATRGTRLVALTGYGQAEDRRRALDAGFDAHVTKPVDPGIVEDLLGDR